MVRAALTTLALQLTVGIRACDPKGLLLGTNAHLSG